MSKIEKVSFSDPDKLLTTHKLKFKKAINELPRFFQKLAAVKELAMSLGQQLNLIDKLSVLQDMEKTYSDLDDSRIGCVDFTVSYEMDKKKLEQMQVAIKTAQVDQDSKERRLQYQYQQAIQSCKALVQVLEHKQCELEELQWLIEKQVYVKDDADEKKFNILMSKIDTSCMLEVESLLEQDEMLSQIPFLSPEQCKQKFTLEQLSEAIEKLKDLNGKLDTTISNAQRLVEFAKEANARFDNKQQKQKELDKKQQAKEKERPLKCEVQF